MLRYPKRTKALLNLYHRLTKERIATAARTGVILPVGKEGRIHKYCALEVGIYNQIHALGITGAESQKFILDQYRAENGDTQFFLIAMDDYGCSAGSYTRDQVAERVKGDWPDGPVIMINIDSLRQKIERRENDAAYAHYLIRQLIACGFDARTANKQSAIAWYNIDPDDEERVYMVVEQEIDANGETGIHGSEIVRVPEGQPAPEVSVKSGYKGAVIDLTAIKEKVDSGK